MNIDCVKNRISAFSHCYLRECCNYSVKQPFIYTMKKFLTFMLLVFISCILAGIYGILHDQLTYTISPEYYTKFKFYQFELADMGQEAILPNPRIAVCYVGFMATWWMGLFIGILLGLTGIIQPDSKEMFLITLDSFLIAISIAFFIGVAGLLYGYFELSLNPPQYFSSWFIPEDLVNYRNFIAVGSMHNFSYLGGIFGLIGGMLYIFYKKYSVLKRLNFRSL